jgi:hypothetical protein
LATRGLPYTHSVIVAERTEVVQQRIATSAATVPEYTVTFAGGNTIILTRRFLPNWAAFVGVLGLLLFLIWTPRLPYTRDRDVDHRASANRGGHVGRHLWYRDFANGCSPLRHARRGGASTGCGPDAGGEVSRVSELQRTDASRRKRLSPLPPRDQTMDPRRRSVGARIGHRRLALVRRAEQPVASWPRTGR